CGEPSQTLHRGDPRLQSPSKVDSCGEARRTLTDPVSISSSISHRLDVRSIRLRNSDLPDVELGRSGSDAATARLAAHVNAHSAANDRITRAIRIALAQHRRVESGIDDEQATGALLFVLERFACRLQTRLERRIPDIPIHQLHCALDVVATLLERLSVRGAIVLQHEKHSLRKLSSTPLERKLRVIEQGRVESECSELLLAQPIGLPRAINCAGLVRLPYTPIDRQVDAAVVIVRPAPVHDRQLALGEREHALGRARTVVCDAAERDGVRDHNEHDANEQCRLIRPSNVHFMFSASLRVAARMRLMTRMNRIAVSAMIKKKTNFGMIS